MFKWLEDIKVVFIKDPAAKGYLEVLLCYPGLHALWLHRIAHLFFKLKITCLARCISHFSRFITGIEIHPGAEIGRRFFIDHGMGVVIGETTRIEDGCLLYQGVVLGGTSLEKGKRHPTLKENVVVGAGAILLGPITVGKGAKIGAGSVVIRDVPAQSTVIGVPGRVVEREEKFKMDLEHGKLPDPVADAVKLILAELNKMEKRLEKIETMEGITCKIDEYLKIREKEIKKEFISDDLCKKISKEKKNKKNKYLAD